MGLEQGEPERAGCWAQSGGWRSVRERPRMEPAAPGVQDADEPQLRSEHPGTGRDLPESRRRLAEEQIVGQLGVRQCQGLRARAVLAWAFSISIRLAYTRKRYIVCMP